MHGAQLHIQRNQTHEMLAIAAPQTPSLGIDEFSPKNTCALVIECLKIVDHAVAQSTSLAPQGLQWTNHFALAPDQIDIGLKVKCDFVGEEGVLMWKQISTYLAAVSPNAWLLFDFGFIAWVQKNRDGRFVLRMALIVVFEALWRVAVRLCGDDLLTRFVSENPPLAAFRYKLLDRNELCSPETLGRLVESVRPEQRQLSSDVLLLAVRVRNAVAHGAVTDFDGDAGLSTGHLLVKSIQCLVDAGEHEMTKVAAYFAWQNAPDDRMGEFDAGLEGERQVLSMLAKKRSEASEGPALDQSAKRI
jgi:hypothetical protein